MRTRAFVIRVFLAFCLLGGSARAFQFAPLGSGLPLPQPASSLAHAGDGLVYAVSGGQLFRSTDDGLLWVRTTQPGIRLEVFSSVNNSNQLAASGNHVYASGVGGGVMYSPDRGQSWQNVTGNVPSSSGLPRLHGGFVFLTAPVNTQRLYRAAIGGSDWTAVPPPTTEFIPETVSAGSRLCVVDPKKVTMSDAVALMTGAMSPDQVAA